MLKKAAGGTRTSPRGRALSLRSAAQLQENLLTYLEQLDEFRDDRSRAEASLRKVFADTGKPSVVRALAPKFGIRTRESWAVESKWGVRLVAIVSKDGKALEELRTELVGLPQFAGRGVSPYADVRFVAEFHFNVLLPEKIAVERFRELYTEAKTEVLKGFDVQKTYPKRKQHRVRDRWRAQLAILHNDLQRIVGKYGSQTNPSLADLARIRNFLYARQREGKDDVPNSSLAAALFPNESADQQSTRETKAERRVKRMRRDAELLATIPARLKLFSVYATDLNYVSAEKLGGTD